MVLELVLTGTLDFVKLLLIFGVFGMVAYKVFSPIFEKIMDRFGLSWIKAALALNLIVVFLFFLILYIYFYFYGMANAAPVDPGLGMGVFEIASIIGADLVRVFVGSAIIAMILLALELVSSIAISAQEKYKYSDLAKEFAGILVGIGLFLIIFLFFLDWVLLGMFVYVFYGGVSQPPTMAAPILTSLGVIL